MDPAGHILVPVDFGAPSLRACDRAIELARELSVGVTVLHAIDPQPFAHLPETLQHLRELAERTMRTTANGLRPHVRELETRVELGPPYQVVVDTIERESPELVVCGTHNRRGLAHFALGSVAEHIVRVSSVPVLTIPGHVFETRRAAGERLVQALASHDGPSPNVVVAIGTDALPVAEVIALKLHATLDLWGIAFVGAGCRVLGAVGEDEHVYYDEPWSDVQDRLALESGARAALREQMRLVRSTPRSCDVDGANVLLVADVLTGSAPVRSATRALRLLGATNILLAAPVAAATALDRVEDDVDDVVCIERTFVSSPADIAFRRAAGPSERAIRRILERATDVDARSPRRSVSRSGAMT